MSLKNVMPATRRAVQNTRDSVETLAAEIANLNEKVDGLYGELGRLYSRVEQADTGINGHLDSVYSRVEQADTGINGHLDSVYSRVEQADTGINGHLDYEFGQTNERLDVQAVHNRLRFESLYAHELGVDVVSARRDFFASIPPAEGDMRLLQLANVSLLLEFDKICRAYGIKYWLAWGALLGALTRGGCIPWDDDIDVCMMREDVDMLFRLLSNNHEYQLTLVYDWNAICRQVRFSVKGGAIPCFIDVCIWDWASDASGKHDDALRALRLKLMAEVTEDSDIFRYWRDCEYLFAPGSGYVIQYAPVDYEGQDLQLRDAESERIESLFSSYIEKATDLGILCNKEDAKAIAYGIDQIFDVPNRRTLWPQDMVLPVKLGIFEGYEVMFPNDAEAFTNQCYSAWPYLPQDMLSHVHFDKSGINWNSIRTEIEKFISTCNTNKALHDN